MSNQTEKLPSGIVNFTISKEELRDILSEKYEVHVESVSFEEEGVSVNLPVPENKNDEEEFEDEFEEEHEGEHGEGQPDVSDY